MHRHGYKGRKLGRERDQRRALIKGLANNLVEREAITTTVPKAKELVPFIEKLITKAKQKTLHSRRQVIAKLGNETTASKLVDKIAPKLEGRNSGHVRLVRGNYRKGDNAELATVSFVDDLKEEVKAVSAKAEKPAAKKAETKKPVVKRAAAAKKPAKVETKVTVTSKAKKPAAKKSTTKKKEA